MVESKSKSKSTKTALVRLCKTDKGWRRYPAVMGKNGKPRPGLVMVNGVERSYLVGRYQVRTYKGDKIVYTDVGELAVDAAEEQKRIARHLEVEALATEAGIKIEAAAEQRTKLRESLQEFISITEARGSMEAAKVYEISADDFITITGRVYADEIRPVDIATYQTNLRKRGLSDRTVANRHNRLMAFFRFLQLDIKALSPSSPRYEEALPEVYEEDDLRTLFEFLADDPLALTYELLLKTGLREQEAVYLEWSSINFERGLLRVRSNPKYGFRVKDKEQRDVPIAPDLIAKLKARREQGGTLVTGTASDRPNMKLLRSLKRAAKRAGLNCGSCGACLTNGECQRWYLHKFRATFLTKLLRTGLDIRTVMRLSGHSDLESVMRYLCPASDSAIQAHIANVVWM